MRKLSPMALLVPALIVPGVLAACDSPESSSGTTDTTSDTVLTPDTIGGDTTVPPQDTTVQPPDTTPPQDTSVPPLDTTVPPQDTTPPEDTSNPPQDTTPPADTTPPGDTSNPGDTTPTTTGVGAPCVDDSDCDAGGLCIPDLPSGYCTQDCAAGECPAGNSCWSFGDSGSFCLKDCTSGDECREADGYVCDADNTCWTPATTPTGTSPIGGACTADADCKDAGALCYPSEFEGEPTGFFQGYCIIFDCGTCPSGSTCTQVAEDGTTACLDACSAQNACNPGYTCFDPGVCFPGCADSPCPTNFACDEATDSCVPSCSPNSCPAGTVCRADGTCGEPPCTANSCGAGYVCAASGECVPDLEGGPGPGPGPTCNSLPTRDCTSNCGSIVAFEPDEGPGYWDYPINGETTANEYRSYARTDLVMLIKWAAAVVDCKAAGWAGGNDEPLGLGDMSEADGSIPGTSVGQPGHPEGTHTDGYDMDIAYFQTADAPDNKLRPVCESYQGGVDQYHCLSAPDTLDLWRTAMFIGSLLQSPRTRIIGVDGKVGPLVEEALDVLCAEGWLTGNPCGNNRLLTYEETDQGYGWFYFHHHHLHISLKQLASGAPQLPGTRECLVPGCGAMTKLGDHGLDKVAAPLRIDPKARGKR